MRETMVAAVLVPLLPLVAGLAAQGPAPRVGRVTVAAAALAALAALVAAAGLVLAGPVNARWAPLGAGATLSLGLRVDTVSAVMALLVAGLGATVLRFARTYLAGDPRHAAFLRRTSLTLAAVLTLALAGDLLVFLAGWVATSAGLHGLLLHRAERPGAAFAARKKLVVSRLGDLALVGALVLAHDAYATFELDALFAAAAADPAPAGPIGLLLVAGAALKSAQFPFHSWLPDTMETPTPVSALMHAGIINAGGYLVIRLSPLLVHAPLALDVLAVVGMLTAAFGAVVMLVQPTVKRALAYSTVAQMGFMLLQCGLGAFGLALVHIVAHSLYKAHAFLTAGSSVGAVPRAAVPLRGGAIGLGVLTGGLAVAGAATLGASLAPGVGAHLWVFAWILALALAYGLARLWSVMPGGRAVVVGLAAAAGLGGLSLVLHTVAEALSPVAMAGPPSVAVQVAAAAVFTGLFAAQVVLWRAGRRPLGRALYVHALAGFYVGTLFNRALERLWPRPPAPRQPAVP